MIPVFADKEHKNMNFNDLPIEMMANIFRYLNSNALRRASRTCQLWAMIIEGDPVLKENLQKLMEKDERRRKEALMKAGMWIRVKKRHPPSIHKLDFTEIVYFNTHSDYDSSSE